VALVLACVSVIGAMALHMLFFSAVADALNV